jgi:peroxiredoxin
MNRIFSFFLIMLFLICTDSNSQLAVGDTAINFTLPDTNGAEISLQNYSGDVILLNFFASWCVPCSVEAPQLQDSIWNVYKNRGFTLIGVDFQEPLFPLINFIDYYSLTFPIVRDTAGNVFNDYGLIVLPSNVLIDQNGIVAWAEAGFDIPVMRGIIDSLLQITSIPLGKAEKLPSQIELNSVYPNPFNNQTNIEVRIQSSALATLKIYDTVGRLLKSTKHNLLSGINSVKVDMTDYSGGVYFYSIAANGETASGKFLLYK